MLHLATRLEQLILENIELPRPLLGPVVPRPLLREIFVHSGDHRAIEREEICGILREFLLPLAVLLPLARGTLRVRIVGTRETLATGSDTEQTGRREYRLTPEQKAELAAWVEAGPDPERDGVVRWRRVDLKRRIEAAFGVVMHERSVGKQLRALGLRRLVPRPKHPEADFDAQEAFKKTSRKP